MDPIDEIVEELLASAQALPEPHPAPKYPKDHRAAMRVPKGGSSCASCEFLGKDGKSCTNKFFIAWNNGSDVLPFAADEFCSDWYEHDGVSAAGTSEGAVKGWDTRGRGVKKLDELPASEIMKEPGTAKIPPGTIRLYHYTGGEGLEETRNNLASIVENGIRRDKAQGESYGEPSVVWGSTVKPHDFKEYVEFWVKPEEVAIGHPGHYSGSPLSQDEIDDFQKGNHDVTLYGDVTPSQIVGVHEDWHGPYRYVAGEPTLQQEIKDGGMNYLLDKDSRWYNDKDSIGLRRWIQDNPEFAPKGIKAYGTSEGVQKAWDTRGRGRKEAVDYVKTVRSAKDADIESLNTWRKVATESYNKAPNADVKKNLRHASNVASWVVSDWEDEQRGSRTGKSSPFFVVDSPKNGIVGVINLHQSTTSGFDHVSTLVTRPDVIAGLTDERGVGTKLMIQAAKYAASRGNGLDLSSLSGAEGFYRKLGMHETPAGNGMSEFSWTAEETGQMAKGTVD
jgi:hypothetical protein